MCRKVKTHCKLHGLDRSVAAPSLLGLALKIASLEQAPSLTMPDKSYLAQPPGECCFKGTIHDGEPRGTVEQVASIDTYIVHPPEGKANGNVVIYFPDVWGFFKNGFLIMDGFADAGYLTVGLDYFFGDPIWLHRKDKHDTTTEPGFDAPAWIKKKLEGAYEVVPDWMAAVKEKLGKPGTKFACVGYCFGAPFVCEELDKDTCVAGAFAHPAFLEDHHIRGVKKPLFLSCSEIDHTFPAESRRKTIDMLIENKRDYSLQLFGKVEHGFALRGNQNDPYERWVKEQSLKGIVDWFDLWLAQ